jgi:hypothetical protein
MKIHKRLNRNVRRTDLHPCTSRRVKHPCRHDNRSARFSFDDDDVSAGALLTVIAPHRTSVECMPPVVNLYFLPNMGRITPRLRSGVKIISSPAPMAAASIGRSSPRSSKRPYAARGITPFMPPAELCRTGLFSPGFAVTGM